MKYIANNLILILTLTLTDPSDTVLYAPFSQYSVS